MIYNANLYSLAHVKNTDPFDTNIQNRRIFQIYFVVEIKQTKEPS